MSLFLALSLYGYYLLFLKNILSKYDDDDDDDDDDDEQRVEIYRLSLVEFTPVHREHHLSNSPGFKDRESVDK